MLSDLVEQLSKTKLVKKQEKRSSLYHLVKLECLKLQKNFTSADILENLKISGKIKNFSKVCSALTELSNDGFLVKRAVKIKRKDSKCKAVWMNIYTLNNLETYGSL